MYNRKFVVTISSVDTEVFPLNGDDLQYKYKLIKDTINYEKKLETKLIFGNNQKTGINDFNFFYSYESDPETKCQDIQITIYKKCNGAWQKEFLGIIVLNEGQWDLDKCLVTHTIKNYTSAYDKILRLKKKTNFSLADFNYLGNWHSPSSSYSNGSGDANFLYYRVAGVPYFVNIDELITSVFNYAPYTENVSAPKTRYPYCLFATVCNEIVREMLVAAGLSESIDPLHSDFFDWNAIGDTPGYVSAGVAKLTPSECQPNSLNTAAGRYDLYLPLTRGTNYVTGDPNKLTHIMLMCKSNANNTTATEWEAPNSLVYNTTTGTYESIQNSNKITFEDIEKIWATMFNAYWFIDADGSMRVEHISWFNNNSHLYDATNATNMKYNVAKNKYEYDKEGLPNKEVFKFQQNRDILNGAVIEPYTNKNNEIFYDSVCVNNEKSEDKIFELTEINTDVATLDSDNLRPGLYDKKGAFMCQVFFNPVIGTYFNSGTGTLGTGYNIAYLHAEIEEDTLLNSTSISTYENGHLQWANLIRRYLKDLRVLTLGTNGEDDITFTTRTIKSKKQKDICIELCCGDDDFVPEQALVKTELGQGSIQEAVYSTKNNIIKMILLHD